MSILDDTNKKIRKYDIEIDAGEDVDTSTESFSAMYNFIMELVNELLDDDVTVVVARVPDCYNVDEINDELESLIAYIRAEFSVKAPKAFILGSCFDIKCTNRPSKIIMWPEIMEIAFTDDEENSECDNSSEFVENEQFTKEMSRMINEVNAPKIITPDIII